MHTQKARFRVVIILVVLFTSPFLSLAADGAEVVTRTQLVGPGWFGQLWEALVEMIWGPESTAETGAGIDPNGVSSP